MATAPAAPTAKFSFKAPLPPSASAYGSSSTLPSSAFSSGFNNNAAAASQAPGTLPTAGKQRRMSLTLPSSPRVVPARHFWDDTSVPYADSPSSSASAFGTLDPEDDGDAGETGEELEGGEGEGVGVDRGANEDNDTTEKEREEKRGEKERAQDAGTGTGHKPGRKIPEAYYLTHYRNARARLQPVPPVLPAPSLHTEPVFSAESRRARRCDVAKTGFSLHTTPGFSAASRRARRRDVGFGGSASSRGSSSHTTSGISRNASQSSLDRFSEAASGDSSFSSSPLKDWNLPSPLKDWNPPSLWKDWNLPSPWKDWNLPSYKLPIHRRILQELDLTGSVTKLDTYPIDSGGSADIYGGIFEASKVAIKIYRRMHSEPQELEQTSRTLYKAARSWSRLNHPNILRFLGVSLDLGLSPALITPLCSSGAVMKYLKVCPKDPTERLQMVIGVAEGLEYLHSQGIVHGNLCTKKILVNQKGLPVICGYGMFNVLGPTVNSTALFSSPIRFAAPEYFSDETGASSVRTTAGDVYAFSMVTLEILSEQEPFHHLPTEHAVFKQILQGGRPVRTHLDYQVVTMRIWTVLTSLWDQELSSRPAIGDVVATLIKLRDDGSSMDGNCEPPLPETTLHNDNEDKLSSGEETSFEETSLLGFHGRDLEGRVKQDDPYPFAGGGNANIYRGKLTRSDGRKIRVAIKMIRMSDDGSGQQEEMLRRLKREADIWSRLKHKNILTFIGVCEDLAPLPVLISPFYKFGHVGKYISKHPKVNREALVLGVASGLQFLHNNSVVHGDLKVPNVLVDKHGVPCICDFGISKIVSRRGFTTSNVGTAPYMAPELFFVVDAAGTSSTDTSSSPSTTTRSDVYSFALLVLEILTAEPPKRRPSRPIITVRILADLGPKQADYDAEKVPHRTWCVLDQCWSFEPMLRPGISELLSDLADCFTSNPPQGRAGLLRGLVRSRIAI